MSAQRNTENLEPADRVDRIAVEEQAEWLEALAPWVASSKGSDVSLRAGACAIGAEFFAVEPQPPDVTRAMSVKTMMNRNMMELLVDEG